MFGNSWIKGESQLNYRGQSILRESIKKLAMLGMSKATHILLTGLPYHRRDCHVPCSALLWMPNKLRHAANNPIQSARLVVVGNGGRAACGHHRSAAQAGGTRPRSVQGTACRSRPPQVRNDVLHRRHNGQQLQLHHSYNLRFRKFFSYTNGRVQAGARLRRIK